MAFNLPTAQYLMNSNSSTNKGNWGQAFQSGLKTAGNLPITSAGTQVQNSSGLESIYFGLNSQNSTGTHDVSTNTKVLLTSVQFNAPNRIQVDTLANSGVITRIGSSAADYKEFKIGGSDTPFASAQAGANTICLDLNATSSDSSGGIFDNTAVDRWGYGTTKLNLQGSSSNLQFFQRVFLFDTTKGGSNIPNFTGVSEWSEAFTAVQGSGYTTTIGKWLVQVGSAFFVPCPFQLGDGTTATNFNDNGATVVSPADNNSGSENFRLSNQAMRVYLNQRDNVADSVILTGSYVWGTEAPWDFNESNNASCIISGASFSGMGNFTCGSSVSGSATFTLGGSSKVIINGADLDGSTINGDCDLQGSTITILYGFNITGTLDFDTAGTYTINNSSIETVTSSVSGVIINVDANTTITTNGSPSNVTINTPQLTLTIESNTDLTGAEIRIYDLDESGNDLGTEIDGVESSPSATFATTLVAASNVVWIQVIKSGFFEYGQEFTMATGSVSFTANLIPDGNL